jgi:hypothetical protein
MACTTYYACCAVTESMLVKFDTSDAICRAAFSSCNRIVLLPPCGVADAAICCLTSTILSPTNTHTTDTHNRYTQPIHTTDTEQSIDLAGGWLIACVFVNVLQCTRVVDCCTIIPAIERSMSCFLDGSAMAALVAPSKSAAAAFIRWSFCNCAMMSRIFSTASLLAPCHTVSDRLH